MMDGWRRQREPFGLLLEGVGAIGRQASNRRSMTYAADFTNLSWSARLRERLGDRVIAAVLTLLIEVLLALAILSLGAIGNEPQPRAGESLVSVSFDPDKPASRPDKAPARAAEAAEAAQKPLAAPMLPSVTPSPLLPKPVVTPTAAPRPILNLAGGPLDISRIPRQPGPAGPVKKQYGPVGAAGEGDSKRVGTAPNGQPLYAAAWYREPYDDELAGYLSTADGPGWALIACRTAPEWRVEDCVALDEYPNGSNIARAVLAASWQFQVRPPRLGGEYRVGDWVRIRIDYGIKRRG